MITFAPFRCCVGEWWGVGTKENDALPETCNRSPCSGVSTNIVSRQRITFNTTWTVKKFEKIEKYYVHIYIDIRNGERENYSKSGTRRIAEEEESSLIRWRMTRINSPGTQKEILIPLFFIVPYTAVGAIKLLLMLKTTFGICRMRSKKNAFYLTDWRPLSLSGPRSGAELDQQSSRQTMCLMLNNVEKRTNLVFHAWWVRVQKKKKKKRNKITAGRSSRLTLELCSAHTRQQQQQQQQKGTG